MIACSRCGGGKKVLVVDGNSVCMDCLIKNYLRVKEEDGK
jgi:hypothetical protein